ncbi:MAG: hypothetical protein ABSD64_09070 [Terriglobales bacterium]
MTFLKYDFGMQVVSLIVGAAVLICSAATAQTCPNRSTGSNTPNEAVLHGTLIHHDELRQWLGLKLDRPTCDEDEIELVFSTSGRWRTADALRNCKVSVRGYLYDGATGYYSANLAIQDAKLLPDNSCSAFPVAPNPALAPRKPNLTVYEAEIVVDYRGKGHVDVVVWANQQKKDRLTPWQAYVDYMLTGSRDVMWFGCADEFIVKKISQTPKPPDEPDRDLSPKRVLATLPDSEGVNAVSFICELAGRQK